MAAVRNGGRAEEAWQWICRGLGIVGFGFLLATTGFKAPMGAYLLLLALFFGPEILKGEMSLNPRAKRDDPG